MAEGPDIARIARLIGEPARANMLTALMAGRALTARELAAEAGVLPQTASDHIAQLLAGGLIRIEKQGRHRYAALAGPEVAQMLEGLMGLAATTGALRTRPGPRDPQMQQARVCYNHLAGAWRVRMADHFHRHGYLAAARDGLALTDAGRGFVVALGVTDADMAGRAPLCRECLDWSERQHHLGGRLGRVLLARIVEQGWLKRISDSRALAVTPAGQAELARMFPA